MYIKAVTLSFSGINVTLSNNRQWWKTSNSSSGGSNTGNYFRITRVIGYKTGSSS